MIKTVSTVMQMSCLHEHLHDCANVHHEERSVAKQRGSSE